jgi:hypothetical protein
LISTIIKMSDASASVAIAAMSVGNTQIVLFGMFIIFVLMIIWWWNVTATVRSSAMFGCSIPFVPMSFPTIPSMSSFTGTIEKGITVEVFDEVPKVDVDKPLLSEKDDVNTVPVPVKENVNAVLVNEDQKPVIANDQQNAVTLEMYNTLLKRVDTLDAVEKDRVHKAKVAEEIAHIAAQIDHADGAAVKVCLESKPMQDVFNHFRAQYPNMTIDGTINSETGEVVCWNFNIPKTAATKQIVITAAKDGTK